MKAFALILMSDRVRKAGDNSELIKQVEIDSKRINKIILEHYINKKPLPKQKKLSQEEIGKIVKDKIEKREINFSKKE